MPGALVRAAEQSLAAVLSVSNIYFWTELNYWTASAKNELLLHTWSLGVEEQFYLFYPFILVTCYRYFSRAGTSVLLVALVLGGFTASEIFLDHDARAAFFLTPLRLNEFALGGLGSLLLHGSQSRGSFITLLRGLGTLIGLALILFSAFFFSRFTPFPGFYALLPTGGALLIIVSGASPVARWLLANPLMTWVGKMSYSLYLVHWPLIVLYRHQYGSNLSAKDRVILLAAIFLLGSALSYLVERRIRLAPGDQTTRSGLSVGKAMWGIGLATIMISVIAGLTIVRHGWPERIPDSVKAIADVAVRGHAREKVQYMEKHCKPKGEVFCGERAQDSRNIMLLADSRGLDFYIALKAAYPAFNIYASYGLGCPPEFSEHKSQFFKGCPKLNRERLTAAMDAPEGDIVFLVMAIDAKRAAKSVETARRLVESGKRVYVLGQSRFLDGKKTPQEIVVDQARFSLGAEYLRRFLVPQPFGLDEIYAPQIEAVGATYISNRGFFQQGGYRLYTRGHRDLLSYDGLHLSVAGAREFGDYLVEYYPLDY